MLLFSLAERWTPSDCDCRRLILVGIEMVIVVVVVVVAAAVAVEDDDEDCAVFRVRFSRNITKSNKNSQHRVKSHVDGLVGSFKTVCICFLGPPNSKASTVDNCCRCCHRPLKRLSG